MHHIVGRSHAGHGRGPGSTQVSSLPPKADIRAMPIFGKGLANSLSGPALVAPVLSPVGVAKKRPGISSPCSRRNSAIAPLPA